MGANHEKTFGSDGYVIILMVVMVSRVYVKTYQNVHFKYVQFTVCQLHYKEISVFLKRKKQSR